MVLYRIIGCFYIEVLDGWGRMTERRITGWIVKSRFGGGSAAEQLPSRGRTATIARTHSYHRAAEHLPCGALLSSHKKMIKEKQCQIFTVSLHISIKQAASALNYYCNIKSEERHYGKASVVA